MDNRGSPTLDRASRTSSNPAWRAHASQSVQEHDWCLQRRPLCLLLILGGETTYSNLDEFSIETGSSTIEKLGFIVHGNYSWNETYVI